MALEQRSSKSTEGIIRKTKLQEYVFEWALVNHEVMSIVHCKNLQEYYMCR